MFGPDWCAGARHGCAKKIGNIRRAETDQGKLSMPLDNRVKGDMNRYPRDQSNVGAEQRAVLNILNVDLTTNLGASIPPISLAMGG